MDQSVSPGWTRYVDAVTVVLVEGIRTPEPVGEDGFTTELEVSTTGGGGGGRE
jgi:hypothetical protein